MRFFDPTLLESALLYVGNMIAQYFTHIDTKVDTSILEAIVRRIYKAKMPSIVQSLVVVYSRFFNLFPNDILKFLTTIQVENKVGLKILIDKWLLHQPLFRGTYYKNVSIKALTTLFEIKNEIVETLMVIGYDPSHSNASVEVNAPFKILSVLVRCLNNEFLQEKMKKEKNDYENLDYNEINRNDDDEYERMEAEQGDQYDEDFRDDEGKVDVNLEDFKNMEEEPRDFSSKLNFVNLQGQRGGLGNIETGSEIYLSEMLVRNNFKIYLGI
jgi:importin-9